MKIYLAQNVYDAALDRIRYLFDEFPNIIVNISGGKDSTVVLNLALQVAEEKGRLPLKVLFIDQEAEWQMVIDHIRDVMSDPRIEPKWLQVPIKIFNATSTIEPWLQCWEPGAKWIRDKEPNSIHDNIYGTDRFVEMFEAYLRTEYKNKRVCHITGMRAQESPVRFLRMTGSLAYKDITWGRKYRSKYHNTFSPIYDWDISDVWKAIHDNQWEYCKIYDYQYQYGISLNNMRVSNVHHETAVIHLTYLQEVEAKTWNKITSRLSGVNTANVLTLDTFKVVKQLPYMFNSWKEYRDYLLIHFITDQEYQEKMRARFKRLDSIYIDEVQDELTKKQISAILVNDYHGTKLAQFTASHAKYKKAEFQTKGFYANRSKSVPVAAGK